MKKELETLLLQAMSIYSQDIGTEFSIEKSSMLIMRSLKRQMMKGIELLNKEKVRTLVKSETYKYLGILESELKE